MQCLLLFKMLIYFAMVVIFQMLFIMFLILLCVAFISFFILGTYYILYSIRILSLVIIFWSVHSQLSQRDGTVQKFRCFEASLSLKMWCCYSKHPHMREGVGMGSIGNTGSRRQRDKVNTVVFVLLSFKTLSIPFKESDKEMVGFHHLLLTERQTIKKSSRFLIFMDPL